jgi:hypothetical protein
LVHADQLFPGATLSKWRGTHQRKKVTQPQKLMEILTEPGTPENISGDDIAKRMGVKTWSALCTNVLTPNIKERVLPNLGWRYEAQRGPGGGARFIKTGNAVLKPGLYKRPE